MTTRSNTTTSRSNTINSISSSSSTSTLSRRTPSIPNRMGSKALYTITTQTPEGQVAETRVLDLLTGTSTIFSNDPRVREVTWIGKGDEMVWMKDVELGATEFWTGDVNDIWHSNEHCAGRIAAKAFHLKVKRLKNEYDDVAVAIACLSTAAGNLYNPEEIHVTGSTAEVTNAIWYTTLRKKTVDDSNTGTRYILSPAKFINALRGTSLESPLPSPLGTFEDFDISLCGIVCLSKDSTGGSINFPSINVYYIPLKTFTEMSMPRPQIINVKEYEGRSSNPVFSANGNSVAFLKKKHPIDQNDRNRVIVINNIREFCVQFSTEDTPTAQSERNWHLSPYTVAWNDNGKELYVVAVDQGIRRLFKISAALSSIKKEPEPITSECSTAADVRHLRMVFSAPMNFSNRLSFS